MEVGHVVEPATKKAKLNSNMEQDEYDSKMHSVLVTIVDTYVNLIRKSNNLFEQYFSMISDFAFTGSKPMCVFLERHILQLIIDLILNKIIKYAVRDNIEDEEKIFVGKAMSTLSILVRCCHTRSSTSLSAIAPVSPYALRKNLIHLPPEDMNKLYATSLFNEYLRRNKLIHTKIANIILHLTWEDVEYSNLTSTKICDDIYELDFEYFPPFFDVLTPFFALKDSLTEMRNIKTLDAYMRVIHDNIKYEKASTSAVKYILDLAASTKPDCKIENYLHENIDKWVQCCLIECKAIDVREPTQLFLLDLMLRNHNNNEKIALLLFSLAGIARMSHTAPIVKNGISSWGLISYVNLLQYLVGNEGIAQGTYGNRLLNTFRDDLLELLFECDRRHLDKDDNKRELCELWLVILRDDKEILSYVAQHDAYAVKLLDFYISVRMESEHKAYNASALPPFFSILRMCCDYQVFLDKLSVHPNFMWAVRFLYLDSDDYPTVADEIGRILKKCSQSETCRHKHIERLLANSSVRKFSHYHLSIFFALMLQTKSDIIYFYEHSGLDFIDDVLAHSPSSLNGDPHRLRFTPLFNFVQVVTNTVLKIAVTEQCPAKPFINFIVSLAVMLLKTPFCYPERNETLSLDTSPITAQALELLVFAARGAYELSSLDTTNDVTPLKLKFSFIQYKYNGVPFSFARIDQDTFSILDVAYLSHEKARQLLIQYGVDGEAVQKMTRLERLALIKEKHNTSTSLIWLPKHDNLLSVILDGISCSWDAPVYGKFFQNNPVFQHLIITLLTDGYYIKCDKLAASAILQFYEYYVSVISAEDFERVLTKLTEQRTRLTSQPQIAMYGPSHPKHTQPEDNSETLKKLIALSNR